MFQKAVLRMAGVAAMTRNGLFRCANQHGADQGRHGILSRTLEHFGDGPCDWICVTHGEHYLSSA
jgi:hypothetical protein